MLYFLVFIYLFFLAIYYDLGDSKRNSNFSYFLSLFILIIISGLRYKVGGDTLLYFESFEKTPLVYELFNYDFSEERYDPFWIIFQSISKTICNDFAFFQLLHSIFVNTVVFYFFRKNTHYYFTAILLYFCGNYFYFNMEIMRESLSISFFLIAYPYLITKKWVKYYLIIFVSYLFHSSAIILFFLPLLAKVKLDSKGIVLLLISFACSSYLGQLIELGLFAARITEKFVIYSQTQALNIFGVITGLILYCFIPLLFINFYNRYYGKYLKFVTLLFSYFFLSVLALSVQGFYRFLNYFIIFQIIFLSDFFITLLRSKNDLLKVKFLFFAFFALWVVVPKVLYYNYDTSMWSKGTKKYNLYYPYSSIIDKEEYFFRKEIHDGTFYE
ncbi:EpsG family protein [Flavobacterium hydrophilum]|uniref:EpsG family protein n=1 Tax=Flavobacterium hydrophilum TaxID=2211445 RepID=A0A2V4BZC6_9FLAO|nr:EpsG family protein [Flavobacterium hydrophilum]PXY44057.1 hypothetical protein DMB68_16585 [Flavobacterium hydrophilum]